MRSLNTSFQFWIDTMKWYRVISVLLIALAGITAKAQEYSDPYTGYLEEVFMDMDYEPNLATPVVPKSDKQAVRNYVKKVASDMMRHYIIDLMRSDEVFVVSIPTDDLFLPNDTLLSPYAQKRLDPLLKFMSSQDSNMYKIVYSVHTDDTGSTQYQEDLSHARSNSVYDWLMDQIDNGVISEDQIIIPYAFGSDDPLQPNDTMKHRAENRRLDVVFIPGPKMIEMAHQGVLK